MDPDPSLAAPGGNAPSLPALDRRVGLSGLVVSVILHLAGLGALALGSSPAATPPPSFEVIDLDTAPVAPAAEALPPEEAVAAATRPPTPAPPLPVEPEPDGVGWPDAGVADAGPDAAVDAGLDAALDARRRPDAGPHDGGAGGGDALDAGVDAPVDGGQDGAAPLVATGDADGGVAGDAGVPDDGGPRVAVAEDGGGAGDGGVALATEDGGAGAGDGGTAVATTGTPDRGGDHTARPSAGTAANLLAYAPAGHVVTLLVRLDRLRGTEWADRVEGMLAPLPDHDALIGEEDVKITEAFETLVVSSHEPSRADATTLVARSALAPAALRDLIDRPDAPVRWTPTRGGALGRRQPSPAVLPGDTRVFLTWAPGWTTLAQPTDLGAMLAPATIGLDHAFAAPDVIPPWLARVATIEDESGTDAGPALMVTAGGMFPATVDLPMIDVDVPGPDRATLTLTVDDKGFVVRGNLRYPDETTAATAADALTRAQRTLLDSPLAALALRTARGWNAVKGLSVTRSGARVSFATSISIGDGRVLLARVTALVEAHFTRAQRRPAAPRTGTTAPGTTPGPPTGPTTTPTPPAKTPAGAATTTPPAPAPAPAKTTSP